MMTIRPFASYVIRDEYAARVVSPAYDALTPEQRHAYARRHPENYVNVMRSLDEYPSAVRPTLDELLATNAEHLQRILASGAYRYDESPCLFLYRLSIDGHVQTGVVAEIPIVDYDRGLVKKHEHTRADKEDLLTRYNEVVGVNSSPVCLAYPQNDSIDALVNRALGEAPLVDFVSEDGVAQTLWRLVDPELTERLTTLFAGIPIAYLTDGHHRAAAGSRYAAKRRENDADPNDVDAFNFLLVALFPHDQLRILPYNRCVRDLNGHTVASLLDALHDGGFDVIKVVGRDAAAPRQHGEFGMYIDAQWYRLGAGTAAAPSGDDPVQALDVSILQERILEPVFGITDSRLDARLDYVAGVNGLAGLEERCAAGWRAAFACYPTSIEELMAVANVDAVMPPKSTWFDPKLRPGIFICMR
jgi:uncharacterized protein (DUF1015 family)